ncbi:hypothetical protein ACIBJF_50185 [Streptomyces sp. NPDC050743]|uniref:hypothetical protein n=1 Tax=Streptomyces sp. NPDC050743 TaxID=3365634 RepID=UPI0037BB5656
MKVPHDGTAPITYDTTQYEYDQVGNTTKVITPRAVAAGSTTAFTQRTDYDALNRPVKKYPPYDPNDARCNDPNVYTQTTYDQVVRVPKTSSITCDVQVLRGSREPPVPPVPARNVVSPLLHRRDPTATVTAR